MTPVQHCVLRMQTLAWAASGPSTSVAAADARTSMDDARIALGIARGVPMDDMDPSSGHDLTRRSYKTVRSTWQSHIRATGGLNDYTRPQFEDVLAYWRERRPEFIEGDDWLAGLADDEGGAR